MDELFANSGDPDQLPDLGLHCLPITLLGVFRLQWVKLTENKTSVKNKMHILLNAEYPPCTFNFH